MTADANAEKAQIERDEKELQELEHDIEEVRNRMPEEQERHRQHFIDSGDPAGKQPDGEVTR